MMPNTMPGIYSVLISRAIFINASNLVWVSKLLALQQLRRYPSSLIVGAISNTSYKGLRQARIIVVSTSIRIPHSS